MKLSDVIQSLPIVSRRVFEVPIVPEGVTSTWAQDFSRTPIAMDARRIYMMLDSSVVYDPVWIDRGLAKEQSSHRRDGLSVKEILA